LVPPPKISEDEFKVVVPENSPKNRLFVDVIVV